MTRLVSICIPTRNRVDFLLEAVGSVLQQAHRPLEILVGDDSSDEVSADTLEALELPAGVALRVFRNRPSLGQSGNVNALFQAARGELLLLLHDDDLLMPGGLDRLLALKAEHPDAACLFGQQLVISDDGELLSAETLELNTLYQRAELADGPVASGLVAGLQQQIPNNGFLVDTALAQRTLYRGDRELGTAVDADFAIRMAAATDRPTVFASDYVSVYRLSRQSILRSSTSQRYHLFFQALAELSVPAEAEPARAAALQRIAPSAALDAANAGERALALQILRSQAYRPRLASLHSLAIATSVVSPALGRRVRPLLKAGLELLRQAKPGRPTPRPRTGAGWTELQAQVARARSGLPPVGAAARVA